MYIISHRGLLSGPDKSKENSIDIISSSINKLPSLFYEIDVNIIDDEIFLGHDDLKIRVDFEQLLDLRKNLILHIKTFSTNNFNSIDLIGRIACDFHFFCHENDEFTITNKGWPWIHPKKGFLKGTIAVMPEKNITVNQFNLLIKKDLLGICTDYPLEMIELLKNI